jgi:hypothetical protein
MAQEPEVPDESKESRPENQKKLLSALKLSGAASVEPWTDLRDVVGYDLNGRAFPTESVSEEPFPALPRRIEILPIDLLGKYEPRRLRITIYRVRIQQVASSLDVPPLHLRRVVSLHEYAHALVHVGQHAKTALPSRNSYASHDEWNAAIEAACQQARTAGARLYRQISDELHEQLAQLLAWQCVRKVANRARSVSPEQAQFLVTAFDRLASVQPREYQIDDLKRVPPERVREVFDMLKRTEIKPTVFMKVLKLGLD